MARYTITIQVVKSELEQCVTKVACKDGLVSRWVSVFAVRMFNVPDNLCSLIQTFDSNS